MYYPHSSVIPQGGRGATGKKKDGQARRVESEAFEVVIFFPEKQLLVVCLGHKDPLGATHVFAR
jgi:hypothetical protein